MGRDQGSGRTGKGIGRDDRAQGRDHLVRIPATVKKGEIIAIQYDDSGGTVNDRIMVTGISINDDKCVIENKRNIKQGTELSDMIYARQCKKLK